MIAIALALLAAAPAADYRARLPQDEVIYFLLPDRFENGDTQNDRGGLQGGPLQTGYDPTRKGFYHGGDLKGLIERLDYIQGLGATAVWVAPIFQNKAVQGPPGQESSGYHGYWITDFTRVDPHFGTNADFKALVDAVHARGMKFYMDIVVNHTADVIQYAECEGKTECPYRSIADYPYQRRDGVGGQPINSGFSGEKDGSAANFAKLKDPNYAYTVRVPPAERNVKVPAWLNDPIYYHNRGNSIFRGESSIMGDFSGLDDVFTENPRVIRGMIEIYGSWIDRFGIDARDAGQGASARHPQFPYLRGSRDVGDGPGTHRCEHPRRQAAGGARLSIRTRGDRRRRRRQGYRRARHIVPRRSAVRRRCASCASAADLSWQS